MDLNDNNAEMDLKESDTEMGLKRTILTWIL